MWCTSVGCSVYIWCLPSIHSFKVGFLCCTVSTVRLSTVARYVRRLGELLGVEVCRDVKSARELQRCFEGLEAKIRLMLGLADGVEVEMCIERCVRLFVKWTRWLAGLDSAYRHVEKSVFTLGDSSVSESEAHNMFTEFSRAVRHMTYLREDMRRISAVPHVMRILAVYVVAAKVRRCLRRCGVEKVREIVEKFVTSVVSESNIREDVMKWLLSVVE